MKQLLAQNLGLAQTVGRADADVRRLVPRRTLWAVCLCAALLFPISAHAVGSINATLDKPQVTVGEPFTYTVTMIIPTGAQATLPGEKAAFKLMEVRDYKPTQAAQPDGTQQLTLIYTLVCFDTGRQGIKGFKVPVRLADRKTETYLAPPLELTVASVLPQQGKVEPKGFYGPSMLPAWWAGWLLPVLVALGVLGLIAGLIWLSRRRSQAPQAAELEQILPPDAAALKALDRLAADDPVAAGDFLAYYLRLDETMRAWLQTRFQIPALERTTRGIMYHLRARRHADDWRGDYLGLLKASDRVKYANLPPTDTEAREHLEQARAVIHAAASEVTAVTPVPEERGNAK